MMEFGWLAMGLAIVTVIAVRGFRRAKARRQAATALKLPGASVETALDVKSLREIDDFILDQSCACGGGFRPMGERSVVDEDGRDLRVARLECGRCEAERLLFFRLNERVLH